MGFNKRKIEDQRAWNERQAKRIPMLFLPTIGAAITAGFWFLWVCCPACRTINAIDLRTLDRHHDAGVTSLIPALSCRSCRPNAPFAELVHWCIAYVSVWSIATNIAAEPDVGFRGTADIVPSGAPSASVANDPKRPFTVNWCIAKRIGPRYWSAGSRSRQCGYTQNVTVKHVLWPPSRRIICRLPPICFTNRRMSFIPSPLLLAASYPAGSPGPSSSTDSE
jgi:hypothetical protein